MPGGVSICLLPLAKWPGQSPQQAITGPGRWAGREGAHKGRGQVRGQRGGTPNATLSTPSPKAVPHVALSGWATGRHSLKSGSELAMVAAHTAHGLSVALWYASHPNNPREGGLAQGTARRQRARITTWPLAPRLKGPAGQWHGHQAGVLQVPESPCTPWPPGPVQGAPSVAMRVT